MTCGWQARFLIVAVGVTAVVFGTQEGLPVRAPAALVSPFQGLGRLFGVDPWPALLLQLPAVGPKTWAE